MSKPAVSSLACDLTLGVDGKLLRPESLFHNVDKRICSLNDAPPCASLPPILCSRFYHIGCTAEALPVCSAVHCVP